MRDEAAKTVRNAKRPEEHYAPAREGVAITLVSVALLLAACSGDRLTAPDALPTTPFVVSNANSPLGPAPPGRGPQATATIAWVSLPAGSLPAANAVTIRVPRTGAQALALVTDGGFDPVPVSAVAGDTVEVKVQAETGAESEYTMIVPPDAPPHVVRTDPPRHKRDVALNYRIVAIFSEPMDSASLASAITLTTGESNVPGSVVIPPQADGILRAQFVPAEQLAPSTTYELHVGKGARDLDGLSLISPVQSDFTTADSAPAPLFYMFVNLPYRSVYDGSIIVRKPIPRIDVTWQGCAAGCDTTFTGNVTLGLGAHPAGAMLHGTVTVPMVDGAATFADLWVDREGVYSLVATAPGAIPNESSAFPACAHLCWERTGAAMPTPRIAAGVAVVGADLYAIGGIRARTATQAGGAPSAEVEAYDPATNTWSTRAPMPTPRYGFGIGVVDGIVYVVGGLTASGTTAVVEAWDPVTNTWRTRAPLPSPSGFLAAGGINGTLYVVGGQQSDSTLVASVLAYDPVTDHWSSRAPLPKPRSHMGVAIQNGQLYVIGGLNPSDTVMHVIPVYDPATDRWVSTRPSGLETNYRYWGAPLLPAIGVIPGVGILEVGGSDGETGPNDTYGLGAFYSTGSIYDPVGNRYTAVLQVPWQYDSGGPGLVSAGVVNGELYLVGDQTYRFVR